MDTKDIVAILEKFNATGLAEMKFREGSVELHVKRHPDTVYAAAPVVHSAPALVPASAGAQSAPSAPAPAVTSATGEIITSPIVGTVYRTPAPDAPPFVEEGKVVKKGETLCIIEAMKVMNELEAEFDCEIIRVLADNQAFVEYGTPLFEVRRK
ncbi:MAG: acetyl-CoA carboxylase biotin carboxyl carrier protein [Spirochaetales bacterium]|nr:acetyl-CoA carboxylase biotin carboxyl carrier protein [Spirochaetales bacterium]